MGFGHVTPQRVVERESLIVDAPLETQEIPERRRQGVVHRKALLAGQLVPVHHPALITIRGTTNAISADAAFSVRVNFAQLFDASALYSLSADTWPESATKKALVLAKKGEVIRLPVSRSDAVTGAVSVPA